ncbi:MAG: sulfurtransferase TusA family protein [Pseudomonadota bacterium]|nr:sulfurtransferase TusA family protein [Pseudomonadota bacterium]
MTVPADETLDATGLRCPMPVIRMEALLRQLPPGARLKVIADDPVAAVDIPLYARQAGHAAERLAAEEASAGGICVFLVTRCGNPGE